MLFNMMSNSHWVPDRSHFEMQDGGHTENAIGGPLIDCVGYVCIYWELIVVNTFKLAHLFRV